VIVTVQRASGCVQDYPLAYAHGTVIGLSPSRSHPLMNKPQRAWRSVYDLSRAAPVRFLIKEDE